MSDIAAQKALLRDAMRRKRRMLTELEQEEAALALHDRLLAFEPYRRARCVMAYAACRGELSLQRVMEDCLRSGRALALPRCEEGNRLTARRVTAMEMLKPGRYGLPEPGVECAILSPQSVDLVLVPGTAFGEDGTRIGQGGGYYDRFLCETHALRVGVCHEFARFESVPAEAHDLRMDYLITPAGVFACPKHQRDNHGRT